MVASSPKTYFSGKCLDVISGGQSAHGKLSGSTRCIKYYVHSSRSMAWLLNHLWIWSYRPRYAMDQTSDWCRLVERAWSDFFWPWLSRAVVHLYLTALGLASRSCSSPGFRLSPPPLVHSHQCQALHLIRGSSLYKRFTLVVCKLSRDKTARRESFQPFCVVL